MTKVRTQKNYIEARYFYRYTNLAAVIHLLKNRQITLLDPMNWDDKNDVFFMKKYKESRKAKTVLALCFAEGTEKYHHWKAFSSGSDGISINFEKENLLSAFSGDDKIEHRHVRYTSIRKINRFLEKSSLDFSELPFLKHSAYSTEREYRVIYTNAEFLTEPKNYDISLCWIKVIKLSPWMPEPLVKSVKEALKSISGCQKLKIIQSRVTDNKAWKDIARRVS